MNFLYLRLRHDLSQHSAIRNSDGRLIHRTTTSTNCKENAAARPKALTSIPRLETLAWQTRRITRYWCNEL